MIVYKKMKVDVVYQDGMMKQGLDFLFLIFINSSDNYEFVAERYVVEKASDDNDDTVEMSRFGVVKSVNVKERVISVSWLKSVVRGEVFSEFDTEEVVSVYELKGHYYYDYCYGDVVVRLLSVSVSGKVDFFVESVEELNHIIILNEFK